MMQPWNAIQDHECNLVMESWMPPQHTQLVSVVCIGVPSLLSALRSTFVTRIATISAQYGILIVFLSSPQGAPSENVGKTYGFPWVHAESPKR